MQFYEQAVSVTKQVLVFLEGNKSAGSNVLR